MTNPLKYFLLVSFFLTAPAMAATDDSFSPPESQPQEAPLTPQAQKMAPLFEVSYREAEEAVNRALVEKGAGGKVAATITGDSSNPLFSYTRPIKIEVHSLTFDKASGRWGANLLAVAESDIITAIPAGGRYDEMMEVPVLKREIRNGDVIGQADIEIRDFPVARTRSDTITDISSLIGKSPARTISAGRPIREHEIAALSVVKKNSLVQMRYSSPGMEITATGQALEDGAKGSSIAVRNLSSKKTVRAVIEDSNNVSVTPLNAAPAQTSQLTGSTPYVEN